ncbi:hypothetical protein CHARACLAT_022526 [Characodon lateralis]|uniref:Uncharacterized protein n=1 Tax=Characodon lateralis TaxID=208331 RepID=A0ABU7ED98_9TELE|nr:hypothetical protein [Characodon lateralis]
MAVTCRSNKEIRFCSKHICISTDIDHPVIHKNKKKAKNQQSGTKKSLKELSGRMVQEKETESVKFRLFSEWGWFCYKKITMQNNLHVEVMMRLQMAVLLECF